MEQGRVEKAHHIVVLADQGQGHINPMLQFSKRLASKGIKITVATTLSNAKAMKAAFSDSMITFESIYDDCSEGGVVGPGGFKGFLDRFQASGSTNLTKFISDQVHTERPVKCLVYDANISWASNITTQLGIAGAAFFTQSCATAATYYPMYCEVYEKTPPSMPSFPVMTGLPKLRFPNLPSLGCSAGRYPPIIMHILGQFDNFEKADWVLFNSFDKLEEEVVDWMKKLWNAVTIGPTLPSFYLDKRVENDNEYGFNVHKPNSSKCMEWLDNKKTGSVVYVSFGSAANLSTEQITEVADALRQSNVMFLWVVKPDEQRNLPSDFTRKTSGKGLVVTWCSQLAILAHHAIGCFISHCGWNSTLEAISFGVPIVAVPQILDQIINAHFLERVWGVGLIAKANEGDKGVTASEEICRCIKEVLRGERGQEIRKNITSLKELAKEAIDTSGSSDKHIDEFIAQLDPAYLRQRSNCN
ncbi:mogroside IE synthase [Capsicum annuum]|uniref:mogroside IE synthase n=1 Tax=Capsicum annuum TaxID=4072 RepID=UPI0007BEFA7F|nr:mogroside IE synthase [Capsicum annuum]